MDGGAWWAAVHGVARSRTRLSDFTLFFHFHALEKEMATHSSVLAWRIPGTGEPGGLPSMGSHRVGHDWSNLAAAAEAVIGTGQISVFQMIFRRGIPIYSTDETKSDQAEGGQGWESCQFWLWKAPWNTWWKFWPGYFCWVLGMSVPLQKRCWLSQCSSNLWHLSFSHGCFSA